MTDNPLLQLLKLLAVTPVSENVFRGDSQDLGWGSVFGGQVLGQALTAAAQTVGPDRLIHSLHAYFLRPGKVDNPVDYHVTTVRDGRSFDTRRVEGIQNGEPILTLTSSFHIQERGYDHQSDMPATTPPTELPSQRDLARAIAAKLPPKIKSSALAPRAIELRPVNPNNPFAPIKCAAERSVWYRATDTIPDNPTIHQYLLAYASDFSFLTTALQPHGLSWLSPGIRMMSLDHSMWFHRPVRMDEWVLHVMESPSAAGARGFVRGQLFTQSGALIASTAQEGLIRQREWKTERKT